MRRWFQTEPRHWLLGNSTYDFYRTVELTRPWLLYRSTECPDCHCDCFQCVETCCGCDKPKKSAFVA